MGRERRGRCGVNSWGPLLVPGRWLSWWDGLGDGLHMALATLLSPGPAHSARSTSRQHQTASDLTTTGPSSLVWIPHRYGFIVTQFLFVYLQ